MNQNAEPKLGDIKVVTSSNGGHTPEFWAEQLTNKIVSYSKDQEPHIAQQAIAYKDAIYQVCLIYINNALKSYKGTVIQELVKGNETDLANIIRRL
jgi:hypothetical protein|tara:strand:- start:63 stop:350 length:288 start_codon:yes stop_codon:yes gene_type:complete